MKRFFLCKKRSVSLSPSLSVLFSSMMNFVYQKDSSVWCTYFSYVHHRRLSLSFLGGATTVTRPASATISLAAAILAVRLAPAPLQRCLSHQIVGVVILRCPLFAAVGRLRAVPTIIPSGLDHTNPLPPTRPLDRLVAAATPASSSIQRYCADCSTSASPRPPDHQASVRRPLSRRTTAEQRPK